MWQIVDGPIELDTDADAVACGWKIRRGVDEMTVIVQVSRTAVAAADVPEAARAARDTEGAVLLSSYYNRKRLPRKYSSPRRLWSRSFAQLP